MNIHDLLAIIHRDGGHYEQEHGTEKAIKDAIDIVLRERAYLDAYKEGRAIASSEEDLSAEANEQLEEDLRDFRIEQIRGLFGG